jgi:hypothetical protein
MRASDLASALTALMPTRRPIWLWGPPGCGKSSIVHQAAEQLGMAMLDKRAVTLDSVDLRGVPKINGSDLAHWCYLDWLPRDGQGVLFLDELPQAATSVQAAFLQLTLDRRIDEYVLPEGWVVIAASNRQEDRAGVNKVISPLLNRFVHLDLEVSVDDWQAWALANSIAPDVRAFIRFRPDLLFQFDPAAGARSFPTPRSWEFVSQVAGVTPESLLLPVVGGCIGEGPAAEYLAFRRLYTQLPDPSVVLSNPSGMTVPTDPAVLYALVGALVERAKTASDGQINALGTFAGRMSAEYGTLLLANDDNDYFRFSRRGEHVG